MQTRIKSAIISYRRKTVILSVKTMNIIVFRNANQSKASPLGEAPAEGGW